MKTMKVKTMKEFLENFGEDYKAESKQHVMRESGDSYNIELIEEKQQGKSIIKGNIQLNITIDGGMIDDELMREQVQRILRELVETIENS